MKPITTYTKYIKYYNIIILKSKLENRKKLKKTDSDYVYYENHHILPKSIFPEYKNLRTNKWNSVLLTAREHFICHILLWKHYKSIKYTDGEIKMSYALKRLTYDGKHNSKMYQYMKVRLSHTDETKRKISQSKMGYSSGPRTEETKRKISQSNKGKKVTNDTKEKLRLIANNRSPMSEETKKKISKSMMGKSSAWLSGRVGRFQTEETKEKISKKAIERQSDTEFKKKLSDAQYNRPILKCPHCLYESQFNMMRWHFDNCKYKTL